MGCLFANAALATITFTASPASQTATVGGTFNVTLSLNITQGSSPNNVQSYDLVFEGAAIQNGISIDNLFSVVSATPPPSESAWARTHLGVDPLNTAGGNQNPPSDHSGFVQSGDEGFFGDLSTGQTITTPISNLQMGTYTFSVASGTPAGTYSFQTTLLATSPSKFTDVNSSQMSNIPGAFGTWPSDNRATFQITVVPEPALSLLFAIGGLSLIGLQLFRRSSL